MARKKPIGERFYNVILHRSEHETVKWLENIEKRYQEEKENISPKLNEELQELFAAVSNFQDEFGGFPEQVAKEINGASWMQYVDNELTKELQTTIDEAIDKLDEIEKDSYNELLNIIWNINNRRNITASFYDYDEDSFATYENEIPRSFSGEYDKEGYYMCLQRDLASLIYNRAVIIVRVYLPKNQFDIYGISFNNDGDWQPVKPEELQESFLFDAETGSPLPAKTNEHYKTFSKKNGILRFPGKRIREKHEPDFKPLQDKAGE